MPGAPVQTEAQCVAPGGRDLDLRPVDADDRHVLDVGEVMDAGGGPRDGENA